MLNNRAENQKPVDLVRVSEQWMGIVFKSWAAFFYAFTRRDFGAQFFGARMFVAISLLWIWESIFAVYANPLLHMIAGGGFLILAILHRVRSNTNIDCLMEHSHYNGKPIIAGKFGISEHMAKSFFEPMLIFAAGLGLLQVDFSLGAFTIVGGMACVLDHHLLISMTREKARRMRNAQLEQEDVWNTYDQFYQN